MNNKCKNKNNVKLIMMYLKMKIMERMIWNKENLLEILFYKNRRMFQASFMNLTVLQ